jgi:medium-chain acyl-[acyl-carrier-protein] hydrolase
MISRSAAAGAAPGSPAGTRDAAKAGAWIAYHKPRPGARVRLYCFPYAGGAASIFRGWADALPAEIEVRPVQPPGRESRIREPAFTRVEPLVAAFLAGHGDDLGAMPAAFFGHSMGALLAYELARALRREGRPAPVRLFVSARRAPHLPARERPIYALPEEEFRAELRELKGTPEEVLDHPELMELVGPLLRADFELIDTYEHAPGDPLGCPISAFGGIADATVSEEEMAGWRRHTAGPFRLRMLPGDHFFLHHGSRAELLGHLAGDLQATL